MAVDKPGFVYIMASARNGTLYIGVTSDLITRIYQHRNGLIDGFTKRYCCKLVAWFEAHDQLEYARLRERQIKRWKRQWKLSTIEALNPDWRDLYDTLVGYPQPA